MSELAINECSDEATAFEFRDEYLRTGAVYEQFRCAICLVPLHARAIYGESFKKAPHFYVTSPKHEATCPCSEEYDGPMKPVRKVKARGLFGNELDLPESLIAKRPARLNGKNGSSPEPKPLTPDDIRTRTEARKTLLVDNQYTTSLLRTVVEARAKVIHECYRHAKDKKLPDAETKELLSKTLASCSLSLYGIRLNYDTAFRSTAITPSAWERIYRGDGTVHFENGSYFVLSSNRVKAKGDGVGLPALVEILLPEATHLDRHSQRLKDDLDYAVADSREISWAAYGKLVLREDEERYVLSLDNPDHFYIRKR